MHWVHPSPGSIPSPFMTQRVRFFSRSLIAKLLRVGAIPTGYTVFLAIGLGVFLLAIGLNAHALPFMPNVADSDAVTSHWPNALFLQRSIQSGDFPLWR